MNKDIVIQLATGAQDLANIRRLRYEILRKPLAMPTSGSHFPGDENESTVHVLALHNAELIGCATLFIDDSPDIQLRGMAVANDWQRNGVGQRIVESAKKIAMEKDKNLWCNARFLAIGFYERQDWIQSGEFFEVPIVGPHIVMKWMRSSRNIA
jgi:GNAT superfamily N-acetyltransferase